MPNEETVEVLPSEDNGNIPLDTPTVELTPVAEPAVLPTQPVVPEEVLYDLPDGRKVNGETLSKEWTQNFLPEFTRKSQELAKVRTETVPLQTTSEDPLDNPDWTPGSYKELIELTEKRTLDRIQKEQEQSQQERIDLENNVASQIATLKSGDKDLNENELFQHATKYGFTNLNVAYNNMKDMKALAKTVQNNTVKNIAKKNDPVSMSPGATGAKPNPANFKSATDYLRSLK